jgi:hypothetical protein
MGYDTHPIGMTMQFPVPDQSKVNQVLFNSPADWISPGYDDAIFTGGGHPAEPGGPAFQWFANPPASDGTKVVITDTHHCPGQGRRAVGLEVVPARPQPDPYGLRNHRRREPARPFYRDRALRGFRARSLRDGRHPVMLLPMDQAFDAYCAERLRTADTLLLGRTTYDGFEEQESVFCKRSRHFC